MMRLRLGVAFYAGSFFAVCFLLFAYLAIRNFRAYFTMRSAEVRVLASDLKIDFFPAPDSESAPFVGYLLRLKLETTDDAKRQISWETEAGKAAYPEEAFDELQDWAPGSVHRIQFLRGEARAIRIETLERSPELESGIGSTLALGIFGLIALFCFTASKIEEGDRSGKEPTFWGPWLLFVGFGALPLIGWAVFTASFIWKANTWIPLSVQVPTEAKAFNLASAPANVEISDSAKEKLKSSEYRLFTFPWNGKMLHGAIGYLGGEFDDNSGAGLRRSDTLNFHISPTNRWALQVNFGKGEDFWVPFLMLLFFGLAFTGAGLGIRKMAMSPRVSLDGKALRKRKS
jgi:hypothetical protein